VGGVVREVSRGGGTNLREVNHRKRVEMKEVQRGGGEKQAGIFEDRINGPGGRNSTKLLK